MSSKKIVYDLKAMSDRAMTMMHAMVEAQKTVMTALSTLKSLIARTEASSRDKAFMSHGRPENLIHLQLKVF